MLPVVLSKSTRIEPTIRAFPCSGRIRPIAELRKAWLLHFFTPVAFMILVLSHPSNAPAGISLTPFKSTASPV